GSARRPWVAGGRGARVRDPDRTGESRARGSGRTRAIERTPDGDRTAGGGRRLRTDRASRPPGGRAATAGAPQSGGALRLAPGRGPLAPRALRRRVARTRHPGAARPRADLERARGASAAPLLRGPRRLRRRGRPARAPLRG